MIGGKGSLDSSLVIAGELLWKGWKLLQNVFEAGAQLRKHVQHIILSETLVVTIDELQKVILETRQQISYFAP